MSISQENAKESFLKIRNQCGFLGICLPWLALFSAGIAQHPSPEWWYSISATYYQSPVLAAVMMPTCLVLYNYIGYDKLDNIVTNLCAMFGIGLVLFPCKVSWIPDGTNVGFFQIPIEVSNILHVINAVCFFLCIAFNSIFLFTKSKPGKKPSPKKLMRNRIYRFCGISTLVLEALFVPTFFGLLPKWFMMPLEILLLTIFGFGWLVKGEFFKSMYD